MLNKAKADASGYYYREKEIEVPVEVEVGAGLRSDGRGMGRAQIPNYVVKADKDEVRERKAPAKPDLANTTSPGDGTLPARTTAQEGTAVPVSRSAPARSAPPRSETTQALARLRSQIEASLPSNGGRAGAGSGDEARITVPSSNANGNGRLIWKHTRQRKRSQALTAAGKIATRRGRIRPARPFGRNGRLNKRAKAGKRTEGSAESVTRQVG